MAAHIHQLSCSPGGVPKRPIDGGRLHAGGLADDWQSNRKYHGGPDRAVCLYAMERIAELQGEGHPIAPGSVGENITTQGLDWETIVPGVRLRLGETAVLEIVSYTEPCSTIRASFRDGKFTRIAQKLHPGWSRVYARVLEEGDVTVGDAIEVLSDGVS
jgi:MOSC domain-containing protein YiiM